MKLGFIGLTPKRIKKKEKIIKNKKCVPTARYIDSSAKPTPILFFILSYLLFNRAAINYNLQQKKPPNSVAFKLVGINNISYPHSFFNHKETDDAFYYIKRLY